MRYPLNDQHNLKHKFDGQMIACRDLGYDVYYIAYDNTNFYLISANNKEQRFLCRVHFGEMKYYRNSIALIELFIALKKAIQSDSFDIIYMRSKPVLLNALNVLKRYKKNKGKLIIEIPTYGAKEKPISAARTVMKQLLNRNMSELYKLADIFVLIGSDCPKEYCGKPAIEISNGVTVEQYPIKEYIPLEHEVHMIAVASMRDWQGYDRIISGMCRYDGRFKLILHLVGPDYDGSVNKWVKLSDGLINGSKVIVHGPMYGKDLDELYNQCHLAVGSMALHRKEISKASTLKVREYAARGIPFIYSYNDSNLCGDETFVKRIQPGEQPVDFNEIVPWIEGINNKMMPLIIRRFAEQKLSWKMQLSEVLKELIS